MSSSPSWSTGLPAAGTGHPRVRQYLNVKHNKRTGRGSIALQGTWALRAAVESGAIVEVAFVCPPSVRGESTIHLVDRLRAADVPVFGVSERVLARMVDRDGPDGIAALGRLSTASLDGLRVDAGTRIVVADRFELAGNLGTLIRCADGAGATAVVVTDRKVRLTHPLVVKASMGTVLSMTLVDTTGTEAREWLRRSAVRVVVADPSASCTYRAADLRGPVAIVLGSERYGIDPVWRDAADVRVSIPMLGTADSLNVGHAGALLLYEALHQQRARNEL